MKNPIISCDFFFKGHRTVGTANKDYQGLQIETIFCRNDYFETQTLGWGRGRGGEGRGRGGEGEKGREGEGMGKGNGRLLSWKKSFIYFS